METITETNLDKNQYTRLLLESAQLAIKLFNRLENDGSGSGYSFRARTILYKLWQRHWRRTAKYNKLFSEKLYIPDWYIAETELENAEQS